MGASRGSESSLLASGLVFEDVDGTYDVEGNDLSVGLLDLAELHQEVPEAGLGNHSVWRKNAHAVQLWRWVCLGWQMAANDLILCETTYQDQSVSPLCVCVVPPCHNGALSRFRVGEKKLQRRSPSIALKCRGVDKSFVFGFVEAHRSLSMFIGVVEDEILCDPGRRPFPHAVIVAIVPPEPLLWLCCRPFRVFFVGESSARSCQSI